MRYAFGTFTLDAAGQELRRGGARLALEPKAFAVLCYLLQHRDRVVSRDDLFAQCWPDTFVSDWALTRCVARIRKALGDGREESVCIQTVRGRGYRFLAPVSLLEGPGAPRWEVHPRPAPARPFHQPPYFVGREAALAQLTQCYTTACQGTRQCVVLTGEAGIGKTALVQAWLAQVAATGGVWVAQGQCLDHYGAGEAYLPVLEALDRLGRTSAGEALLAVLDQQAPMWLAQLPALLSPGALEAVQRRVVGATRERMLREMANALDMFTQAHPLVLILEDLHWSDAATLDLLAAWARRPDPARLLVLGTYRPVDVMVRAHALKALTQDLEIHGQCTELPLALLSAADVARYLAARFAAEGPLAVPFEALARTLYQRTEGHPLFLTAMVDDLVREGVVQAVGTAWVLAAEDANTLEGIPASLRRMIVQQYEELSPQDQQVVEAASVAGMAWSAAAVAAGLGVAVEVVEASCAALARRGQFLTVSGLEHWPDGTVAESYRWRHTLYQEVCYDRVPAGRRVRLHRRIGTRLEAGYGAQACVRAAVLADHFVRGHDAPQAVPYLHQAAQNACQRHGYQEAIGHLTRGLALLATLPETLARAQQELALHIALGPAVMAIKGTAHPEVEQIYARARALCQHVGDTPHLFETLWGLCRFYRSQAALQTARELGEQLAWLAERAADPMLRLEAHDALGTTLFYLGDYAAAWTHVEKGIALTDPTTHHAQALRQGEASGLRCLGVAAQTLWCLGYPAQALQRCQEALALAQELAHPYSLAAAHHWATSLSYRRRESLVVQTQTDALLALATAQQFPVWAGHGACWRGWIRAWQGAGAAGLAEGRQGMAAVLATGQRLFGPLHLVLLAETAAHAGDIEEGLRLLAEALATMEATGQGDLRAEAYRLQGILRLSQAVADAEQAEACIQKALVVARRQQAKSWELRAAMSLSRLWQQQGKRAEARELLAPVYGWFTEGFDTADLQDAKALLEECAR